jgi:hypothetical protein
MSPLISSRSEQFEPTYVGCHHFTMTAVRAALAISTALPEKLSGLTPFLSRIFHSKFHRETTRITG